MRDLVDRSRIMNDLFEAHPIGFSNDDIVDAFKNAPTIDAVEVVRCMDCKRHYDSRFGYVVCALFNRAVRVDGYCSYGCKIDAEVE